ncbi:transposase [Myxococcus fulvus]|uniref:Transposase n=1 Tax=Myxococcus fulvus TaxID=33 RepID=A0A511TK19_MYXFU|nr:transposase [Myxococcus fulvus]
MRYELNERQWRALAPLLPHQGRGGAWKDHRLILNGILWRLHTGAPWRDVPARYGPWQTVYDRFVRWRRDGTWERLMRTLQAHLQEQDELDMSVLFVDSTVVRASRAAAGGGQKGGHTSPRTTPWDALEEAFPPSSTSPASDTAMSSPLH